jgi:hypothetical protein
MVAGAGIAALIVAAVLSWNIFKHSGAASALNSAIPPGASTQPGGSGHAKSGGSSGNGSSGSQHSGSGTGASGGTAGKPGSNPATGGHGSADPSPTTGHSSGGPSASPSPSGGQSPSPTPTPTPTPSATTSPGVTLPAGYKWHKFSAAVMGSLAGFKMGMPSPWTQSIGGQVVHLSQPVHNFHLNVSLSYWLYAKPLREAQYLQTQAAGSHKHGYRELALSAVGFEQVGGFRAAQAAELKYTWTNPSLGSFTEMVILVTLPTKSGDQPYEFALWAPAATFPAANSVLQTAMPTFRPLPGA